MADDACQALGGVALAHARVESATMQPGLDFPARGDRLAAHAGAHCAVRIVSHPTADSDIHVELWLPPVEAWNGKYLQKGSGGWGGEVYTYALVTPLNRGYATAVTDDGHVADDTAGFTVGHPQKIRDFGYRAIHETFLLSRRLIAAYYGRMQRQAYFVGCSDGGREALMQAQRFPNDFDGIVDGAPAARWSHLMTAFVANARVLGHAPLPVSKLAAIQKASLAACDALDGTSDGIVDDPRRCRVDPAAIQCNDKDNDSDNCLTAAQVATVRALYAGPVDPVTGARIHPGLEPGMEDDGSSWRLWVLGGEQRKFGFSNFADLVYQGQGWDPETSDLHRDLVAAQQREAPYLDAVNPDLRAFRAHGGKLLLFQGWGDAAVPPRGTIEYVQDVGHFMARHDESPNLDDFTRLFMVPGMGHCWGGPGATSFGNEEVPRAGLPQDADHDIVMALDRWVTQGKAPEQLIATRTMAPAHSAARTRLLCKYPGVARDGRCVAAGNPP
ncbi:MAG TPA: tannase/feruloyl esterase family alpha/beta hydrolase [Pinirhizobacter sp.]|jgi:feruloyl esterase